MDSGEELLPVAQDVPALRQSFLLPLLQLRPLQLVDLVAQGVHTALPLRLIHGQGLDLLSNLRHGPVLRLIGPQSLSRGAEAVQIGAVALLVQEKLAIVLTVYVQKAVADLAQQRHGDGPSVGPAGVLSIGVNLPLQEQLPALGADTALLQHRQVLRHAGEQSTDKGLAGPGTDQIPRGPLAQHRTHGVNHNGLTRASLTGEDVEAGVESNLGLLDHRDILNVQQLQHSFTPSSDLRRRGGASPQSPHRTHRQTGCPASPGARCPLRPACPPDRAVPYCQVLRRRRWPAPEAS